MQTFSLIVDINTTNNDSDVVMRISTSEIEHSRKLQETVKHTKTLFSHVSYNHRKQDGETTCCIVCSGRSNVEESHQRRIAKHK